MARPLKAALKVRKPAPRLARDDRVGAILGAAREVFCRKGYAGAAVAEIAARMGAVEGTVYKYFPTKRDLLLRVLENWYEDMFGQYERDLKSVRGARARLRLLIWRHLRSVRDNPLLCRLMFREVRSEQDYRGSELHARNRRYTRLLTDVVAEGVAAGDFRGDIEPALLRDLVYGGVEHHTWNYVNGRGGLDVDRIADQMTAIICEGVRRASPPPRKPGSRAPSPRRHARAGGHPGVVARNLDSRLRGNDRKVGS